MNKLISNSKAKKFGMTKKEAIEVGILLERLKKDTESLNIASDGHVKDILRLKELYRSIDANRFKDSIESLEKMLVNVASIREAIKRKINKRGESLYDPR